MQVLCHDFGAKRAFLLKAAEPTELLIYFQDFRGFSNPGIRRFLTDLDTSPPLHSTPLLTHTLLPLLCRSVVFALPLFISRPPPPPCTCFLTLVVLASAVCQLKPFRFNTFTCTHTHKPQFKYGKTQSHIQGTVYYKLSSVIIKVGKILIINVLAFLEGMYVALHLLFQCFKLPVAKTVLC